MKKIIITIVALYMAVFGALNAQKQDDTTAFKACKQAVYAREWQKAAGLLDTFCRQFSASGQVAEGLYWLAFSQSKLAETLAGDNAVTSSTRAFDALKQLLERFPKSTWCKDARLLRIEVASALVKSGHGEYQKYIENGVKTTNDSEDVKLMALDALMNMDSEQAMPLLKKILRENKSEEMRAKAAFVIGQFEQPETIGILTESALKDPSPKVREQAIFWLSQQPGEASLPALLALFKQSADAEVKDKVLFGISQVGGKKALAALADIARQDVSPKLKEQAVFWISQEEGDDALAILADLYAHAAPGSLKEKIIFGFSQIDGEKGLARLIDIARNEKDENAKMQAVFWISQCEDKNNSGQIVQVLGELYGATDSVKVHDKVLQALSQTESKKAISMLIDIARKEKNSELRKKAVFWIGQSNTPEGAAFLKELIEKD
jgi:HEAT repeat protein